MRPRNPRPYKVGMARPPQRVIAPDEIYSDMARGRSAQIPRAFPYSWNPVNGVGDMGSFFDDAFNKITDAVIDTGKETTKEVVGDTKRSVEERAGEGIQDLINSGPGQQFLDVVEERATAGVTAVVKENAPNLMMLAVAGGAVGGALSAKLGKTGTVLALGVAAWASWRLLNATVPVKKK